MHVTAKQMAFMGLSTAMAVILVVLGSLFEVSTFFFLSAASFLVGIIIREFGIHMGTGFYLACSLLSFLLSPNKLYSLTFSGLSLYIVLVEASYRFLSKERLVPKRNKLFPLCKWIIFNLMYLPTLLFCPQLIVSEGLSGSYFVLFLIGGQFILLIYDRAYEYFQSVLWEKYRKRFFKIN